MRDRWLPCTLLALVALASCESADDPAAGTTGNDATPSVTEGTQPPTGASNPEGPSATEPAGPTTDVTGTSASTESTNPTPPETSPDATTTTAPPAPPDPQAVCLDHLPLRRRVALLVWPAVYSSDWSGAVRTVSDEQVGGVILMKPQGWTPDDLAARLAELESAAEFGVVVATDEEGGQVQRLTLLGELPSQQTVSEQMSPAEAGAMIAAHGLRLRDAGVDMVLGPVVDVTPEQGDVPLQRSRFFTGDGAAVATYGAAYVDGWQSAGLTPVLKHYPGHGTASADTHDGAGRTVPLNQLLERDLIPYLSLAESGAAVMVGHLTVPGLTDELPATASAPAVDFLREDLAFGEALVISDALGMGAVGSALPEASVQAVQAGIDVVIFTDTGATSAVIDALEQAVLSGRISDDQLGASVRRVARELGLPDPACQ